MPKQDESDVLHLAAESESKASLDGEWTILVVDDDEDVHSVTNLVLQDEVVLGRKTRLLHAYSGRQAIEILKSEPEVALILLDVVMDTDDDGLMVATYVRLSSNNPHTRIIMRTGQPGMIGEHIAAKNYQVNYYEPKSQLTGERLRAVVHMAIDAYRTSEALAHTIESLQCALEDLELFSSAVAHDLKTPARQVALMSDVLLKDLPDNLPAKSRELIVQIGTTGRHQIDMIDQLLDLSQLGKGSLNFSMVMVDELIDNTLEKVRFNLNEELNISLDIDPDIVLHVDREKFQHVIENLVENACKYRSKERALHIEFKAKCTDRTCKIDVSDNGLGINPAALDTIFLPFRRTNTEANIEGTGIGLAVCKRIIALHDGTISASSKEGEGATICIALPAV